MLQSVITIWAKQTVTSFYDIFLTYDYINVDILAAESIYDL